MSVGAESIAASVEGVTKSVSVAGNISWVATCESDWVTLTPANGEKGTSTLKVSVAKNTSTSSRTATVKVVNSEYRVEKQITITQEAFVPELEVSDNFVSAKNEGEVKQITVTSNVPWTATCEAAWVTLSPVKGTKGTTTFTITVASNAFTAARSAKVSIVNREYSITKEIDVNQRAFTPILKVQDITSYNWDYAAGEQTIDVEANVDYNISVNVDWLSVGKITNGIKVRYTTNSDLSSRSGQIVLGNEQFQLSATINVTQAPFPAGSIIRYTTSNNGVIMPNANAFGTANIVSVTNKNGEGIIKFDSPVTMIGAEAFKNCTNLVGLNIPTTVTSIGNSAFSGCSNLANMTIPDTVIEIGESAFRDCSGLKNITISNGIKLISASMLYNCSSLASINIPNGIIAIGNNAFYGCNSLTRVTIPNNVTTIGSSAFSGCSGLEYISIPTSVTSIGGSAFSNCTGELVMNSDIVETNYSSSNYPAYDSSYWLYGSKFSKLTVGNTIKTIGNHVFRGCSTLENVILPSNLVEIGSYAFYGCSKLKTINIPAGITSIASYVFYNCSSLTNLTIPESVSSIESYALYNCSGLLSVVVPRNVTFIGSSAFYNCTGELVMNSDIIETNYSSGNYPAYNSSYWLYGSKFSKLTIGSTVNTIGNYVFNNYDSLKNIAFPNNITEIGNYAFNDCDGLNSITLPNSITSIGNNAFYSCGNLTSVYIPATTIPQCNSGAFSSANSGMRIYVPIGYLSRYQSAWSSYSSLIVEVPYTPTECTSLTITADDVEWDATTTTIRYTAVTNGTSIFGPANNVTVTGTGISSSFAQNMDKSSTKTRTVSFTYLGKTATTTITQGKYNLCSYTVNLNNQWRLSSVSNPNTTLYDGVYESNSNYGQSSSSAWMYININGYDTFTIYVRSYAESSYDYVTVYNLDSTSSSKYTTQGKQNGGTSISSYSAVTFSNIGGGSHRIAIKYSKDGSVNEGNDRGYVLIPKNQ